MRFRPGPAAITAAALFAAVVSLGVFGQRLVSTVNAPDFGTVCDQSDALYGVWKLQHGLPLYEDCRSGNYCVEVFNFGFYALYAAVLGLFGVSDAGLMRAGKFLTLGLAVAGTAAHVLTLRELLEPETWRRWRGTALAAVLLLWFSFTNWFVFSVRCDLPAMAFTAWALWVYLRYGLMDSQHPRGTTGLVLASLLFAAAWSCKQVYVWSFSSLVVFECLSGGGVKRLAALALPFGGVIALSLWIGGRLYFENTILAPSLNPWHASLIVQQTAKAVLAYPFIFVFAALGLAIWAARTAHRFAAGDDGHGAFIPRLRSALRQDQRGTALVAVALGTTMMNVVSFGREGAIREHIFESALTLTTLALVTLATLGERRVDGQPGGRGWWALAAVATFTATAALPLIQLLAYGGSSGMIGRLHVDFVPRSPTLYARPDDYARVQALDRFLQTLPKPIFTFGLLGLPWSSNDNQFPAFVVLPDVHEAMARRGLLRGGGWRDFYRQRSAGTLLLEHNSTTDIAAAQANGYRVVSIPPEVNMRPFTGHAFSVVGSRDTVVLVRGEEVPGSDQPSR